MALFKTSRPPQHTSPGLAAPSRAPGPDDDAPPGAGAPRTNGASGNHGPRAQRDIDFDDARQAELRDRSIGDIIRSKRTLSDSQIEQILLYQRKHDIRFGEAAVALQLASDDDVMWALSQQFHYPYAAAGQLQRHTELVVALQPFGEQAEAFRELRSQVMMGVLDNTREEARRALAVVSPDVGDGKTFFAANLAVAFSQLGGRTLLVDADMRTPRQHAVFGVPGAKGLSNVLSGRSESNVIHQIDELPSLYLLPVGAVPPNPLELVQRPAFTLLLQELTQKFDYVVVDTPAAVHGADARVLAAKCGAALAIGRRGKTRMPAMRALVSALAKGPARMAGVVMNEW